MDRDRSRISELEQRLAEAESQMSISQKSPTPKKIVMTERSSSIEIGIQTE